MPRPLRILIAPDAFKECMTAREAAEAMERGAKRAAARLGERIKTYRTPISDGGAGLIAATLDAWGGGVRHVRVAGPLGGKVRAPVHHEDPLFNWRTFAWTILIVVVLGLIRGASSPPRNWGWIVAGASVAMGFAVAFRWPLYLARLPVVESSSVIGLHLIAPDLRDPGLISTAGLGELVAGVCHPKVWCVTVGLGNTASCDGGVGMLTAMGVRFYDRNETLIERPLGEDLARIARIDASKLDRDVKSRNILCVCDVDNPLFGPQGAARLFAPQKGASPEQVERLDTGLRNLARRVREAGFDLDPDTPGSGAAGGLGYALMAVCGAGMIPGAQYVLDINGFAERVENADLVLTGAGRLDATDLRGKAILGVSRVAADQKVPTIALVGSAGPGADDCLATRANGVPGLKGGLAAYHVITPPGMAHEEALRRGPELLEAATERVVREWLRSRGAARA